MQVAHFPCPQCGISLRTKGRIHLGKTLPCPDCGTMIDVVTDNKRQVTAVISEQAQAPSRLREQQQRLNDDLLSAGQSDDQPAVSKTGFGINRLLRSEYVQELFNLVASPVGIAWSVAGVAAICLLLAIWLDRDPTGDRSPKEDLARAENSDSASDPERPAIQVEKKTPKIAEEPASDSVAVAPWLDQPLLPEFASALVAKTNSNTKPKPPKIQEKPAENPAASLAENGRDDLPPVKAPMPRKNVRRALEQSILAYHQSRPVAVKDMLLQVQQLADVEIVIHLDADDERMLRRVTIAQDKTTLVKILSAVLESVGLIYRIQDGKIHVQSG